MKKHIEQQIRQLLRERILVLDGAMGTAIQEHNLGEADYRGERFADHPGDLKGNNDLLTLTQPRLIRDIHGEYLAAGADLIETNTFNSTSIAMADYRMEGLAYELNRSGAELARAAVDEVATAVGKLNRLMPQQRHRARKSKFRVHLFQTGLAGFTGFFVLRWIE